MVRHVHVRRQKQHRRRMDDVHTDIVEASKIYQVVRKVEGVASSDKKVEGMRRWKVCGET